MNDFQLQMTGIPASGMISDTDLDPIEGAALLAVFFGLGKTLRLVGHDNDTFKNQIGKFWERFKNVAEDSDKLTIKIVDGRLFINENLCRTALKSEVVQEAIDRWDALAIGGVEICYQPETDGLATLFQILNQASGRITGIGFDFPTHAAVANIERHEITIGRRVVNHVVIDGE